MLAQLQEANPDDVRVVYRHFPLTSHDKALLSTQAAEAAGLQGKFWEMHDLLFAEFDLWSGISVDEFRQWLVQKAGEIDLDVDKFQADLDSAEIVAKATDAQKTALDLGIPGTPTLAINGQYYDGPRDFASLQAIVGLIKLEERQFTVCPQAVIDPARQYRATLKTEKGDIVVELFADRTPVAVNNFVFLAQNDWFDGVTFHRVLEDFVAQSGDPTGTGYGGPGYAFKNEIVPDLTFDSAGLLAMANAGPDSNGSQFFITFSPQAQLNGGFTIFGRVIEGLDVARSLTLRNPAVDPTAPAGDAILDVVIEEK